MKVVRFIFTLILQILLIVAMIGLGIMLSAKEFAQVETISENIQAIEIQEILVDKKGKPTATGKKVRDLLKSANIKGKDADIIINDSTFKAVVSDFISSATLHQVDETTEIIYPTENAITNIIYNNFDALKESYQIDKDKSEITKERIKEEVSKNYSNIKAKLKEFAESMGENYE